MYRPDTVSECTMVHQDQGKSKLTDSNVILNYCTTPERQWEV